MQGSLVKVMVRRRSRGFTMVELMAVVAIVGILALLATYSVRKYVASSKTSEAVEMIGNIKAAQENYKDETFTYLNVSTSIDTFYPANSLPGRQKMNFAGSGDGQLNWQKLGVQSTNPVLFVYSTVAGAANTAPSSPGTGITIANWPATTSTSPWYVVKAKADLTGNGVFTEFVSASFAGDMFSVNN